MPRIRVLIVDDAVVARRAVMDAISVDPEIEVVGVAATGKLALARIEQLRPDLVTLDVEMPEWDGIRTLIEIRKRHVWLPVIMVSTLTEQGAAVTLDALTQGASDYVAKPARAANFAETVSRLRAALVPKIKALASAKRAPAEVPTGAGVAAGTATMTGGNSALTATGRFLAESIRSNSRPAQPIEIITIAASTGGPNALMDVLKPLPAAFPVPIVIVQHMPPTFTRHFAARLTAHCKLRVDEAVEGDALVPGRALLAPGDWHMIVGDNHRVRLHQGPPENFCRPAADVLIRSAVEQFGAAVLAVVLTGMGRDGFVGCQAVHAAGGQIIVQDESTSVVWGMPGTVAHAQLPDRVLPLPHIAGELIRRVRASSQPI